MRSTGVRRHVGVCRDECEVGHGQQRGEDVENRIPMGGKSARRVDD
jgi:hypothetical protein